MIGESTLVLVLALALALPLSLVAATSAPANSCDIVTYGAVSVDRWVYKEGKKLRLVVEWSTQAEGAASALLVAALRLAGYRDTVLRKNERSLPLRSKYTSDTELLVMLAARWSPGDVWDVWLRALGAGVAPVAPRLHRRCLHRRCPPTAPGHKLYVVEEWNRNESTSIDRGSLLELVTSDGSEPFTFYDVEVWSDLDNVVVDTSEVSNTTVRAIRVADTEIWVYGPNVWHLLSYFQPERRHLRHLLAVNALADTEDPMLAVCEWATADPEILAQLRHWADYLNEYGYIHYAYVYLCTDTENDTIDDYYHLVRELSVLLNSTEMDYRIALKNYTIKCEAGGEGALARHFGELSRTEIFRRSVGVVGFGPSFDNVPFPKNWTVMSYSTYGEREVGATSGRPATVVRALRDLLAACRWTRLAVLSEPGRVATELSAALRAAPDLNSRDVPSLRTEDDIRHALDAFMESDARIFLVNGGARFAGEVMRTVELRAEARADRVWLVREWAGGAGPAAPHELTFAWRGGDGPGAGSPLYGRLAARWARRGSWPLYAAPLADAVLALGMGYQHILKTHHNFFDDVRSAFRTFWNLSETKVISSGVVQKLQFKDRELVSPRVFLYRWNGSYAVPVGQWELGDVPGECPVLGAVTDGSTGCYVPIGDRFDQRCADWYILAGVVAAVASIPMVVMAAVAVRRAVRARDAHLVKRTEEMLEARWRAKASRLEPYFVERRALELREQVGAGRFGRVWLGFLREPGARDPGAPGGPVAAKALREDAAPVEETEFFREARALAALQHEHVVRFVGVCVTDGPPLLLMEYAFFGDLLRYLRARRHLVAAESPEAAHVSPEALTRFARQAATALAYLARRGFVHRDVRAANCLVDERRSLKLADFGMARATRPADGDLDGDSDGEYTSRRRALFPVLWMAPESLSRGVFSAASDVWALGVLALELVTLGARPYGSLSPLQVHHYVVTEGRRPPLPRELAAETRAALLACWRRAPASRPPAGALAAWLLARPRALQPAPHAATEDRAEDVDSGIGDSRSRSRSSTSPPPARSSRIDDVLLYDDDASLS